MQVKTEHEARGGWSKAGQPTTEKAAKDFGEV